MLKLQKRSEPFFDRKLFFSFCSTGHLKRSSDKFAEYFWPKVQKGLKVYPKKRNSSYFFSGHKESSYQQDAKMFHTTSDKMISSEHLNN